MPSLGLCFFILGLVVASVTADETTTRISTTSNEFGRNGNYSTAVTPLKTNTHVTSTTDTTDITTTSIMNITDGNSTSTSSPLTTKQKGDDSKTTSTMSLSTPKPIDPSKRTTPAAKKSTTAKPKVVGTAGDSTGIIILVVIIIVALGFGVACYFARRRGRRYSVDFTSRPDEVNIPLSTVEPELPIDTVPQNGLQTFETPQATTKDPQEPEVKPEVQEEQKAEADKSVVDPSAESAAPAPSPDSSADKPKEDVVEQSPPAPVEEKTDDEGAISNKTSEESLKETNENNSNNADFRQKRDLKRSKIFWDVPLDSPV